MNALTYIKNVGKSFGYIAIDTLSSYNPKVTEMGKQTKEFTENIYQSIKDITQGNNSKVNEAVDIAKETVTDFIKNGRDDLLSGKIYNKERNDAIDKETTEAMWKAMGMDMSELDFNFDDDFGDWDDDESAEAKAEKDASKEQVRATIAATNATNKQMDIVGGRVANVINKGTVKSTEYLASVYMNSTSTLNKSINKGFVDTLKGIVGINNNLSTLVSLSQPLTAHMQNSMNFYTKSTEYQNKSLEYLKQIAENTKSGDVARSTSSSSGAKTIEDIMSNGVINMNAYLEMITNNIKEWTDFAGDMMEFMGGPRAMIKKSVTASPLAFILKPLIDKAIPAVLKESMKSFNSLIEDSSINIISKISRSYLGPLELIKDIFLPDMDVKKKPSTGRYNKGKVAWDGIARKALVDVIPQQLGEILMILRGDKELRKFDYQSGKWKTISDVRKEERERQEFTAIGGSNFYERASKIADKAYNSKNAEKVKGNIKNFLTAALTSDSEIFEEIFDRGDVSYSDSYKKYGLDKETFNFIREILEKSDKSRSNLRANALAGITKSRLSNKNTLKYQETYETDNPLMNLYNNAINENNPDTNEKTNRLIGVSRNMHSGNDTYGLLLGIYSNVAALGSTYAMRNGISYSNYNKRVKLMARYSTKRWISGRFITGSTPEQSGMKSTNGGAAGSQNLVNNQIANAAKNSEEKITRSRDITSDMIEEAIREEDYEFSGLSKELQEYGKKKKAYLAQHTMSEWKDSKYYDETKERGIKKAGIFSDWFKGAKEKASQNPLVQSLQKFINKIGNFLDVPAKSLSDLIDDTRHGLNDLIFGESENDNGPISFGGFLRTLITNPGEAFSRLYHERIKESVLFGQVKQSFSDVGNWIGKNVGGLFGYEPDQAAKGRHITKSGVITVSEGEMVIPSEYNPYYNGFTNKAHQIANENRITNKYLRHLGNYAGGGEVSADEIQREIQRNPKKYEEYKNYKDKYEAARKNLRKSNLKKFTAFARKGEALGKGNDVLKEIANGEINNIFDFLKVSAATLASGTLDLVKEGKETTAKIGEQIKETTLSTIFNIFPEIKGNEGNMIAGAIMGLGGSLLTGGIVSPILAAGLGSGIALAIKSNRVKDVLFGEEDEQGNRAGGVLGAHGEKFWDFMKKYGKDMGIGGIVGTVSGTVLAGSPVAGLFLGSAIGFAKNSEEVKNYLFGDIDSNGERMDNGLFSIELQKKVKEKLPKIGAGGLAGLLIGPFPSPVMNLIAGSAIGFAADTEKVKDILFGEADENGKRDKEKGLVGGIYKHFLEPAKGVFEKLVEETRHMFRGLTRFLAKTIKNTINGMKDWLRTSALAQFFQSSLFGKVLGGFAKVIASPLYLVSGGLKAANNALEKRALKRGYRIRGKDGKLLTAKERIDKRAELGIGGGKFDQFDQLLATGNEEELTALGEQLRGYKKERADTSTSIERGKSLIDRELKRAISRNGLYDSGGGEVARINKLIKAGDFDKAREEVSSFPMSESHRRDLLKMIDEQATRVANRDKLSKQGKALNKKFGGKLGQLSDGEIDSMLDNIRDEKASMTVEDKILKESQSIRNIVAEDIPKKLDELIFAILNPEEARERLKLKKAEQLKKFKSIKKDHPDWNAEQIKAFMDGDIDENGNPITAKGRLLASSLNINSSASVKEGDKKDENGDHMIYHNGQWIKEDDYKQERSFKQVLIDNVPFVSTISSGIDSFTRTLGNIKDFFMGDGKDKEGIFSKIQKFLFGDVPGKGLIGKVFNFFKDGSWIKVLSGALATGLSGLILGAATGLFDNLVNKLTGGAFGKGGNTDITDTEDEETKETDEEVEEDILTQYGSDPRYRRMKKKPISPTQARTRRGDVDSLSTRLWKQVPRSILTGAPSALGLASTKLLTTKTGSKLVQAAMKSNIVLSIGQAVSGFISKMMTVPMLKGFGTNLKLMEVELKEKLTKETTTALLSKEALEAAQDFVVIANIIFAVVDFTTGYEDAKTTLGIVQEPTMGQRIISGLLRAIKNIIPIIGVLIPDSFVVDIFCKYIAPAIGEDPKELLKQRQESQDIVDKYNNYQRQVGGKTVDSVGEFNKSVLQDYTWTERFGNSIKTTFNQTKAKFSEAAEGIKEKGFGEYVASEFNKYSNIFADKFNKDKSLTSFIEGMGDVFNDMLPGLFGDIAKANSEIATKSIKGELLNMWNVSLPDFSGGNEKIEGTHLKTSVPSMFSKIMGNIPLYVTKITFTPIALVGALFNKIFGVNNGLKTITDGIATAGNTVIESAKQIGDMVVNGFSFETLFDTSNIPDNIPLAGIFKAASVGTKIVATPFILMQNLGSSILERMMPTVEELGPLFSDTYNNISFRVKAALEGDISTTLFGNTLKSEDNPYWALSTLADYSVRPTLLSIAGTVGTFKLIGGALKGIIDGIQVIGTNVVSDQKSLASAAISEGSISKVLQIGLSDTNKYKDNPILGGMSDYLKKGSLLFWSPIALMSGMLKPLSDKLSPLFDKLKDDGILLDNHIKELKGYADNRNFGQLILSKAPTWSKDNPISPVFTVADAIAKSFFTIAGIVDMIGSPIIEFVQDKLGWIWNNGENTISNVTGAKDINQYYQNNTTKSTAVANGSGLRYSAGSSGFVNQSQSIYGDMGCGPAAAVNAMGGNIRNADALASKYQTSGGTDAAFFADYFGRRGREANYMNTSSAGGRQAMYDSIASGTPTVLMGRDPNNNSKANSPFGRYNHYIVGKGFNSDGTYNAYDSELGGVRRYSANTLNNVSLAIGAGGSRKIIPFRRGRFAAGGRSAADWNLGSFSPLTAQEINDFIKKKRPDSPFNGHGDIFVQASKESGLDPRYILAHAAVESAWGTSHIARTKHNYFGIAAYDSNPGAAYTMGTGLDGIIAGAKWISKNYYHNAKYKQTTVNKMRYSSDGKHNYCTSTDWPNTIANIMEQMPENKKISFEETPIGAAPSGVSDYISKSTNGGNKSNTSTTSGYNDTTGAVDDTGESKGSLGIMGTITGAFAKLSELFFGKQSTGYDNPTALSMKDNQENQDKSANLTGDKSHIIGNSNAQGDWIHNFPYFNQGEDPWASTLYGNGTIKSSGCGPTSMAMVLKSYGVNTDPNETARWSLNNGFRVNGIGTSWDYFSAIAKENGLDPVNQFSSQTTAEEALKNNIPVIASMRPGDFTKGGHFLVLTGLDNNELVVNDPGSRKRTGNIWDKDSALSQAKQFWSFTKNGKGSLNKKKVLVDNDNDARFKSSKKPLVDNNNSSRFAPVAGRSGIAKLYGLGAGKSCADKGGSGGNADKVAPYKNTPVKIENSVTKNAKSSKLPRGKDIDTNEYLVVLIEQLNRIIQINSGFAVTNNKQLNEITKGIAATSQAIVSSFNKTAAATKAVAASKDKKESSGSNKGSEEHAEGSGLYGYSAGGKNKSMQGSRSHSSGAADLNQLKATIDMILAG